MQVKVMNNEKYLGQDRGDDKTKTNATLKEPIEKDEYRKQM